MLTLPSRSQSTFGSRRTLSNGSTTTECRGLTPRPGPAGRVIAHPATPRTTSPAAATVSRRRAPARR
jgi:hypothetical protein